MQYTHPATEANVDLGVEGLEAARLCIDRLQPDHDTGVFRGELGLLGVLRVLVGNVQALHGRRQLLLPSGLEILEVVEGRQGLGEIHGLELGSEAAAQEGGQERGWQGAWLGWEAGDLVDQLRAKVGGRVHIGFFLGGSRGLGRGGSPRGKEGLGGTIAVAVGLGGVAVDGVHGTQRNFVGSRIAQAVVEDPGEGRAIGVLQ